MNPSANIKEPTNPKELETEALPLMDWLYNFAFYLTDSQSSAKKIIKRTYYKVLEYYDKTRGGADYKSWMIRVILNRVYEFYEKRRDTEKKDLDKDFLFKVISLSEDEIHDINEKKIKTLKRNQLLEIIKNIPIDLKLPLMFQTTLNYGYEKSSEFIDIPEGTIASRIFRARKWIFNEIAADQIKFDAQLKLDYSAMKYLASEVDSETLGTIISNQQTSSSELFIQKLVKNCLNIQLTSIDTPGLLKTKFTRKVRKIVKKSIY